MYTFKNTEINNKKASEFETKSLLYLFGMRKDSNEIEYVTVDCFNDVTGSNNDFTKLWDIQSKNHISLPPSKIGESLFTLYDNFISKINFTEYILFIPKLERNYLIDSTLNIYNYKNINEKTRKGIEKKLKSEIARVKDDIFDPPALFYDFLKQITFVEDNKQIITYIKEISNFKNKRIYPKEFYENIFKEIRDKQTGLKNSYIENKIIFHPKDVLSFERHITKQEINTLIINRLIGVDIFSNNGIPVAYLSVINSITNDTEDVNDLIQDCNENLSRAFFNKNDSRNFWIISEFIILTIKKDPKVTIYIVYDMLIDSIKIKSTYLTKNTILYMISLVIEGVNNDN
ncbi:MAG: hypothetical protein ACI81I_001045 [Arcobacteraceae bacterium]|jgi:hypothetical protein